MKALVIYDSKYGSTKEIAEAIGEGLVGLDTEVLSVEAVKDLAGDLIVLGSPIYAGKLLPGMIDFLTREKERLLIKNLGVFIVCGDKGSIEVQGQKAGGRAYLDQVARFLQDKVLGQEAFLGRMKKDQLDQEDQDILDDFSKILGVSFPDFNGVDLIAARNFGEKLKEMIKQGEK